MKKVIVIVVGLLSLLTSLYASRASFVVSNEIASFSYEKQINEPLSDDNLVTLNISDLDIITLTTKDDKTFDAKLAITDQESIDALFSWGGASNKVTMLNFVTP